MGFNSGFKGLMQTVRIIRQIITIDTSLLIRKRRIKGGKVYIFKVIYLSPIFIFIIIFWRNLFIYFRTVLHQNVSRLKHASLSTYLQIKSLSNVNTRRIVFFPRLTAFYSRSLSLVKAPYSLVYHRRQRSSVIDSVFTNTLDKASVGNAKRKTWSSL